MNKPCPGDECCCPGDHDDNLWITLNDYQPPKTQIKWEQTCFLDNVIPKKQCLNMLQ
ncbi:unnamed protein product, partial [Rotaria sp. Silwood2]